MNQRDTPKSEQVKEPVIEEGLYSWWAGGVIVGAIVLAMIAAIVSGGVELPLACVGVALFFLICFDTQGNFRRLRGILLGGVLLFIGTTLLHKKPPRLSVIIVATTLFFVYLFCASLGHTIGKVRRSKRTAGRSD